MNKHHDMSVTGSWSPPGTRCPVFPHYQDINMTLHCWILFNLYLIEKYFSLLCSPRYILFEDPLEAKEE